MPRGPAARILDPVVHPLPGMLLPGPGSLNVITGGKLQWRGVPAAAAAAIGAAKATSDATIKVAEAATLAAAGTARCAGCESCGRNRQSHRCQHYGFNDHRRSRRR